MSFGFSIGDFFAVGTLAWNVYKSCKDAGGAFAEISHEVISLHTSLKELEDEINNPDSIFNRSGTGKKKEVSLLVKNCERVLQQLNKKLIKYKSFGTASKRTFDRLRWSAENLQEIREKILAYTSSLTLFLTTLGTGSLGRIEKKLDQLMEDVRAGNRAETVLTSANDGDDPDESEAQWILLKRKLIDDGFSKSEIEVHKQFIKAKLRELIENGALDEQPELDTSESPESHKISVPPPSYTKKASNSPKIPRDEASGPSKPTSFPRKSAAFQATVEDVDEDNAATEGNAGITEPPHITQTTATSAKNFDEETNDGLAEHAEEHKEEPGESADEEDAYSSEDFSSEGHSSAENDLCNETSETPALAMSTKLAEPNGQGRGKSEIKEQKAPEKGRTSNANNPKAIPRVRDQQAKSTDVDESVNGRLAPSLDPVTAAYQAGLADAELERRGIKRPPRYPSEPQTRNNGSRKTDEERRRSRKIKSKENILNESDDGETVLPTDSVSQVGKIHSSKAIVLSTHRTLRKGGTIVPKTILDTRKSLPYHEPRLSQLETEIIYAPVDQGKRLKPRLNQTPKLLLPICHDPLKVHPHKKISIPTYIEAEKRCQYHPPANASSSAKLERIHKSAANRLVEPRLDLAFTAVLITSATACRRDQAHTVLLCLRSQSSRQ